MTSKMELWRGDCLELMKNIPDKSIDMVLTDPPYGQTECKWDSVVDFKILWPEIKRISKNGSAIAMFGSGLFTARLSLSNADMYRYSLIWRKTRSGRYAQAKLRFLNEHEDILIFSNGKCSSNSKIKMRYFPQGLKPLGRIMPDRSCFSGLRKNRKQLPEYYQEFTGYPKSILEFQSVSKTVHPTQKPVALLEYLIKSYTLKGETVLDFTMGSGSTGIACKNLDRGFIGIEKDDNYFEIASRRINA